MSNISTLLSQRTKKTENASKMATMAKQSAAGQLTSFAGVFSLSELSQKERDVLEMILREHIQENVNLERDLEELVTITSEVKAIQNQAAILHGERIKRAHDLLTPYRDGAFTAWLVAAYGNRQTPYNLMQYYEFYEATPKPLRKKLETMPRQAIYALASRNGSLDKKREIVENYTGETKAEMLQIIRQTFPLEKSDRRRGNLGDSLIQQLNKLCYQLRGQEVKFSAAQKKSIKSLLNELSNLTDI